MARKRIDLASIIGSSASGAEVAATRAARAVRAVWAQEARRHLSDVSPETRQAYINNIRIESSVEVRPGVFSAKVILHGVLPNIIENGMGPGGVGTWGTYDVRRFVLKGRKFVNVKFNIAQKDMRRWMGASGMTSAQVSTSMERVTSMQAGRTPRMQGTAHHITIQGERMHRGLVRRLRARSDTLVYQDPTTGRRTPVIRVPHTTDPLHGMVRRATRHTAGSGPQATYSTFRRMSAEGKPWWSPGVKPHNVARIVRMKVPGIVRHIHGRP